MSPYPTNELDGDKSDIPENKSFDEILFNTCNLLNNVNSKLIELTKLNNNIKYSTEK